MKKFKYIMWLIITIPIIFIGLYLYIIISFSQQDLLLHSAEEYLKVPSQKICKFYLFNFKTFSKDIQEFNENGLINSVIGGYDNPNNKEILQYFLDKGADANSMSFYTGFRPIHAALFDNDISLLKLLIKYGADPKLKDRNDKYSPLGLLDLIIKSNKEKNMGKDYTEIRKYLLECIEKFKR